MRDRKSLQHHPVRLILDLEFIEQPRLAHAVLCNGTYNLSVPRLGQLGRVFKRLHLSLSADELRVAATRRTLQPGSQWA